MARPLRIEYPGAYYHITARGNRREDIFLCDNDRELWFDTFGNVCKRYNWRCHGYCLMSNHYHLIIETLDGRLSAGMRQLNGVYTQAFNRLHDSVGHVFQGRYKSIIVDKDEYLLELNRYVVLNPVRAGMVTKAGDWQWSSFSAAAGTSPVPGWLSLEMIPGSFHSNRQLAQLRYQAFVLEGIGRESPLKDVNNQIFLGDEEFVARHQDMHAPAGDIDEIPRSQRLAVKKPLAHFVASCKDTRQAMVAAYNTGHYTMKEIAAFFDVHYATVSRAVKKSEKGKVEKVSQCAIARPDPECSRMTLRGKLCIFSG